MFCIKEDNAMAANEEFDFYLDKIESIINKISSVHQWVMQNNPNDVLFIQKIVQNAGMLQVAKSTLESLKAGQCEVENLSELYKMILVIEKLFSDDEV